MSEEYKDAGAEINESLIEAVNKGRIPLIEVKELGYDVEAEMIARNISIPDQDIVRPRFYKRYVERTMLSRGTKELLKFFTKDEIAIFFKQVKEFISNPIKYVKYIVEKPIEDADFKKRYEDDPFFRKCVDIARADILERIIDGVHKGDMGLLFARHLGYDVEQEMIDRNISIPDQDLLNIRFYETARFSGILKKGIKELLNIYTQDEVADYLELVRVNADEKYLDNFPDTNDTQQQDSQQNNQQNSDDSSCDDESENEEDEADDNDENSDDEEELEELEEYDDESDETDDETDDEINDEINDEADDNENDDDDSEDSEPYFNDPGGLRAGLIEGIRNGDLTLAFVEGLGYYHHVKEEMEQRGIPIPDQEAVRIRLAKDAAERKFLWKGTTKLREIFRDEEIEEFFRLAKKRITDPKDYVKLTHFYF